MKIVRIIGSKKRLIFSEFITSYHLNLKCFDGKVRNPLPTDLRNVAQ